MTDATYNLSGTVIGLAMKVQSALVPGYAESVYKKSLVIELIEAGMKVEVEKRLTVRYRGVVVGEFVADIVVNDVLIIELKAVTMLVKAHEVQLVYYLTRLKFPGSF